MNDNVILSVKNLYKKFGKLEVLKGIDIDIKKGDVVAVIGPSGCGKSTFLRCLNRLETPTAGEILFEGNYIFKNERIYLKKRLKAFALPKDADDATKTEYENLKAEYAALRKEEKAIEKYLQKHLDLHRQKIGMVFQQFNLFPHLTVLQNVTLAPIRLKKVSQEDAQAQAQRLLKLVG